MVEAETRGTAWEGRGCPWIDYYLERYRGRPVEDGRNLLRRYVRSVNHIGSIEELRAGVVQRARDSLREWLDTGRTPTLPDGEGSQASVGATPTGEAVPSLLRWATPGAGPVSDHAARMAMRLGPGEPVPSDVASRFAPELGPDLAAVRVHRGARGAEAAGAVQAHAFTLGPHVAFGPGLFRPGTPEGDALIAHELAHATARGEGGNAEYAEQVADDVATSAVERLWTGNERGPSPHRPAPRRGLEIRRCDIAESQEPTIVGDKEMRSLGWSIRAPESAIVGQSYRLDLIDPGSKTTSISRTVRPLPLASWYARRPDDAEFGRGAPEHSSGHAWTLDAEGSWSFAAETYLGQNRRGILIHTVVARRPNAVAEERLAAVKPTTVTQFLIGLEQQNLTNIRVGVTDQRFAPAYITLQGANPERATASWPNLPENIYTVHPPPGQSPTRYQWLAIPNDFSQYPSVERFDQQRRIIDGREGFDLGTSSTARWTISRENGIVEIYCRMFGVNDALLSEARFRQVVLDAEETEHAKRFQTYMSDVQKELANVREDAVFVPAVHLATEGGAATELSFFLGRATGSGEFVLLDLTPGVPRRTYGGANWDAVLKTLNDGNSYPPGQIVLRVQENSFGVGSQDWRLTTTGASLATRLSTAWGWASLGLAGLGALAMVAAPPLAPVFFLASGTAGAASVAASLYQQSQEAHPSGLLVAVNIASLAGSMIGSAGAANILRHGPRIAAATRMGQFVLYAGFATETLGGVFMAVEGAEQIADILSNSQRRDDQISAIVRILSGMLLNGTLLAWSAHNLGATRTTIERTLGKEIAGQLDTADLHALSILDEATVSSLRSVDESRSIAALIREDPVRAGRLAQVHGGSRFLESARARPADLQVLSDTLDLGRQAATGAEGRLTFGLDAPRTQKLFSAVSPEQAHTLHDFLGEAGLRKLTDEQAGRIKAAAEGIERAKAASVEPLAAEGLRRLGSKQAEKVPAMSPNTVAEILASVPPARMELFLRVVGDVDMPHPRGIGAEKLERLASSVDELGFIGEHGAAAYNALRKEEAFDPLLKKLHGMEPEEAHALVDKVRAAKGERAKLKAVDIEPPVRRTRRATGKVAADKDHPDWSRHLGRAEVFAKNHRGQLDRTGKPYDPTPEQIEMLAAMYQLKENAWSNRGLPHDKRVQMLDEFDALGRSAGLKTQWINNLRGGLSEALFAPSGGRNKTRLPHPDDGFTILDYAFDPGERAGSKTGRKEWVEQKSDLITAPEGSNDIFRPAVARARRYVMHAELDMAAVRAGPATKGDTILIEFVRSPGNDATEQAMLKELFGPTSPIQAVKFADGVWIERAAFLASP